MLRQVLLERGVLRVAGNPPQQQVEPLMRVQCRVGQPLEDGASVEVRLGRSECRVGSGGEVAISDFGHQGLATLKSRHDQGDAIAPLLRADLFAVLSHRELAQPGRLIDADRTEHDPAE
jgi:hypothetical protein